MTSVPIVYVGKKPFAVDNVAGSGKAWNGNGDVQTVTPAQAKVLIRFSDQWKLANGKTASSVESSVESSGVVEVMLDGEVIDVDVDAISRSLDKLSKPELLAIAKAKIGKEFSPSLSKKVLLDEIRKSADDLGINIESASPLGHAAV